MVGLKANGSLAGVVVLQLLLVHPHGFGARVEGAMVRARAKGHEKPAVQTECGKLIADALFSLGGRSSYVPAELLEGGALVFTNGAEVVVDALGFPVHDAALRRR